MQNQLPFYAYKGNEPYIFISYSHKDSEAVFSIIRKFNDSGYRIWYDEGIDPGNEWPEEIGTALSACALFVVFISPRSALSENVRNEINFALAKKLPVIVIHLEETELTAGMQLQIGAKQAIMKYNMTDDSFYYKCDKSFGRIGLTREVPVENKITPPVTPTTAPAETKPQIEIPVMPATPIAAPIETKPQIEIPVLPAPPKTESNIEIPENAIRFNPKGTATITLTDKTQYTVSANTLMFFSTAHIAYSGVKNGLLYKDGKIPKYVPFAEIKEYKNAVAVDWDDDEYEILTESSQLYVIETNKKREPLILGLNQVENIIFDHAHTFNSVAEYALIEVTNDVPLVVPTASISLDEYTFPLKHFSQIPFKNEAAVPFKSILSMEITKAVLSFPEDKHNYRLHVEITVIKRNHETVSDEINGLFNLNALTRKGLMHLRFDEIKKITFM
jgi:hypothetical protein